MDLSFYFSGLHLVLKPDVIFYIAGGTLFGIIFGALPGLTATAGIAIIIPITYYMDSTAAIAMLLGIYLGGVYGGCVPAILIDIPGAPGAIMTSLDGHPMAKRGEAGRAIGIATVCSFLGGIFSVFILALLSLPLAKLALSFSAQEYSMVALFGITMLAYVTPRSTAKGIVSGVFGLLISSIGQDPVSGFPRFVFGQASLYGGISFIPVMIGLYGMTGVIEEIENVNIKVKFSISKVISNVLPKMKEISKIKGTISISSIIGVIVGAIPGTGASIASIIAYGFSKRTSKNEEKYGTGCVEGIASAESANNAATGGTLIPTLSLGIPGDAATAVLIGALILHGLEPGPLLIIREPEFTSSIFLSLIVSNFFVLIFGLIGAQYFARIILIPRYILTTAICIFCLLGAYAVNYNFFDLGVMLFFGVMGYILKKYDFSVAPMVLGIILGPIFESNVRRALIISKGDWTTFFTRPISLILFIIALSILFLPNIIYRKKRYKK